MIVIIEVIENIFSHKGDFSKVEISNRQAPLGLVKGYGIPRNRANGISIVIPRPGKSPN